MQPVRNGRGIVAMRGFRVGEPVCQIHGRIVTPRAVWKYWDEDPTLGANCYRFAAERYLDPRGKIGAFANHSCRPNVMLVCRKGFLQMRAIAPIAPGDEVTHDYSTYLGADDVWTMRCNCGERGCRGTVRRFDRLPQRTLNRYLRLGAIPGFILRTR